MADILIRGMEMPKDHPVLVFIWPDGRVFPYGLYESNEWDEVKAIPIPEGHGRIGDLDALKADVEGFIECMTNNGAVVDGEMLWGKLLDALDNAKTIAPAEGGTDDV